MAIRFLNVKSVSLITGLGYYASPSKSFKEKIYKAIITLFYKAVTTNNVIFAFQNTDDIDFFKEKKILKSNRYCITPGSGINIKEFCFSKPIINPISFLFIGRLLKSKGIDLLLKSAKEIKSKYPEIEFNIIGKPDPLNPDSIEESVLKDFDSQGTVNYIGEVRNVIPYFEKPKDAIKDPYILEFIGLPEHSSYSEGDLEQELIDKLKHFLNKL